jgi:hypothetical protein
MSFLTRLAIWACVLCFPMGVQAQVITGTGIVCNEAAQLAQVVVAKPIDVEAAIQTVNDISENACGRLTVAFVKGEKVGTIYGDVSAYELYEITVIGAYDGQRWTVIAPQKQYTAVFHKGRRS